MCALKMQFIPDSMTCGDMDLHYLCLRWHFLYRSQRPEHIIINVYCSMIHIMPYYLYFVSMRMIYPVKLYVMWAVLPLRTGINTDSWHLWNTTLGSDTLKDFFYLKEKTLYVVSNNCPLVYILLNQCVT